MPRLLEKRKSIHKSGIRFVLEGIAVKNASASLLRSSIEKASATSEYTTCMECVPCASRTRIPLLGGSTDITFTPMVQPSIQRRSTLGSLRFHRYFASREPGRAVVHPF
ncbi:Os03g0326250 [Oryza sativa Japonica Group]|uniref:Os03g0326250 protein n=1 Tax=Oryza sativa subsp. japonica TaxID=39947 RepID=A0A0N7KH70_ORYSJ|nr:Os03g0326250 [Oryza sativa Japonica Group]